MDEIIRRIKLFEGYSQEPYLCPAGKWTIGYGYNFHDRGFKTETLLEIINNGFDKTIAEKLLKDDVTDIMKAVGELYSFYQTLDEVRKAVVTDMVYQLGLAGFSKFRRMIRALEASNYTKASEEMKDSRWFSQSGRRSIINTEQMKTGQWQEV